MIKLIVILFLAVFIRNVINNDVTIVNGNETNIESHPWQAAVNVKESFAFIWWHYHHCGGVIIGKKWILTAAHCFKNTTFHYDVRVGTSKTAWWGSIYEIKQLTLHPFYTYEPLTNDIAIIELVDFIDFDEKKHEIKMADVNFTIADDQPVQTSGFGRMCVKCETTDDLMVINLSTISLIECRKSFPDIMNQTYRIICAADINKTSTTCSGDSGGPLTVTDENNKTILIGLIRGGNKCDPSRPASFSFLPAYREWIKNVTGI